MIFTGLGTGFNFWLNHFFPQNVLPVSYRLIWNDKTKSHERWWCHTTEFL